MSPWTLPVIVFPVLLLAPLSAFAQSEGEMRQAEADRARIELERNRDIERRRTMDRLASSSAFGRPPGSGERQKFLATVPEFREATAQFRDALGFALDTRKPIKVLEKLIGPLRDYFSGLKMKRDPVNLSEYKDLSATNLAWETLTTAERVDNSLQMASLIIEQSQRDGSIHIKSLEFFGEIHDDLNRLRWLADRMSEIRTVSSQR
jgi:hypothetical protein